MPLNQLTDDAQITFNIMADELEETRNTVLLVQKRIHDIHTQIRNYNRETQADALAPLDQELLRQQTRLTQTEQDYRSLARVHTTLRNWIEQLPRNIDLQDAKPTAIPLQPGQSALSAVEHLREEIDELTTERNHILRAIPAQGEIEDQLIEFTHKLCEQGTPQIRLDGGKLHIKFPDKITLATLMWLHHDRIEQRLLSRINDLRDRQLRDGVPVMSGEEKVEELRALDAKILGLERSEEALIRSAASEGTTIPRREHASPLAMLGLRIKHAKEAPRSKEVDAILTAAQA